MSVSCGGFTGRHAYAGDEAYVKRGSDGTFRFWDLGTANPLFKVITMMVYSRIHGVTVIMPAFIRSR